MENESRESKSHNYFPFADGEVVQALWAEFEAQFPTEQDCLDALLEMVRRKGRYQCSHCSSFAVEKIERGRAIKCNQCKKETWLTAGTFFDNIRRPRAWLGAIWFMGHGLSISALRFKELVKDIAVSSTLNIFHKLRMVILADMDDQFLARSSAIFQDVIRKRSRLTPARKHPFSEQSELEKEQQALAPGPTSREEKLGPSAAALAGLEKQIYELLADGPVHTEELCNRMQVTIHEISLALVILETEKLVEKIDGNRYVRRNAAENTRSTRLRSTNPLDAADNATGTIISYILINFHGISRKYLQLYLAEHWCCLDRLRWAFRSLLGTCQRSEKVREDDIKKYETPLAVKIWQAA